MSSKKLWQLELKTGMKVENQEEMWQEKICFDRLSFKCLEENNSRYQS